MNRKATYLGLNEHHRISWTDDYNRICVTLAKLGFSIVTIARHTGLTQNQVVYRLRKRGLSVMDYRNGVSAKALAVLNSHPIRTGNQKTG
jgi:hypothetical protein